MKKPTSSVRVALGFLAAYVLLFLGARMWSGVTLDRRLTLGHDGTRSLEYIPVFETRRGNAVRTQGGHWSTRLFRPLLVTEAWVREVTSPMTFEEEETLINFGTRHSIPN